MKKVSRWKKVLTLICTVLMVSSVFPSPVQATEEAQQITEEQPKGEGQPAVEQPKGEEPTMEQPKEEPAVEQPKEEPTVEQPKGEEPTGEQPKGEGQPAVEQPKEEPTVEQPKEEPAVEQPKEEPTVEQPKGEEPTGEQPKGEESNGEQPKGEESNGEQPAGEKKEPESVEAVLEEGLDAGGILTTQGSFHLQARLTPSEEEGVDSTVTWEVTEGDQYVELDDTASLSPSVTIKDLDQAEVTVCFQVTTANEKTDDLTVTLKKAEAEVKIDETTFTYGDTERKLTATVNGTPMEAGITFTLVPSGEGTEEAAEVSEDGTVTIRKAGTFHVKAAYAGDGTYLPSESGEQEVTVLPKTLPVGLTDDGPESSVLTKVSDGTTALTDDNKKAIRDRIKIDDSQLVGEDQVELKVEIPDTVRYGTTRPGAGNCIRLQDLSISLDPVNGNYELDPTPVTGSSVAAEITAIAPKVSSIDMKSEGREVQLQGNNVSFAAGIEGRTGTYWYSGKGIKTTLPEDTAIVDASGTSLVNGEGYLTMDSGGQFYINQEETWYGPYTITYQTDTTSPEITKTRVEWADGTGQEGMVFDEKVIYTIEVTDEGSGVKDQGIQYGISPTGKADGVKTWLTPVKSLKEDPEGTWTFRVETEGSGYLFVKAADNIGNEGYSDVIRAIVLESGKPELSVQVDKESYEQNHTVTVGASDAEEEGTSPYSYSGIAQVTLELKNGEGEVVYQQTEKQPSVPEKLEDLPAARTFQVTEELQKGNTGAYADRLLDGAYDLTVTVLDNCGNSTEKMVPLYFDNTAPAYTVTMEGGNEASDGNWYYRAENCGVAIQVEDARLEDGVEYTASVGNVEQRGNLKENGKISFSAAEIAGKLDDGTYVVKATVTDHAGNRTEVYTEATGLLGQDGRTGAAFILDKTAPAVTAVRTAGEAKGPYDGNDYYYKEENLTVTFDIAEENAMEDQWAASMKKDGADCTDTFEVQKNQVVFHLSEDGKYTDLTVSGADLAGNPLTVSPEAALTDPKADAVQAEDGRVTMSCKKVVDHVAPVAVIDYPEAEPDHIYADGTDGKTAAYYNTDLQAVITVTDTYGSTEIPVDMEKLTFRPAGGVQPLISGEGTAALQGTYEYQKDGEYAVSVYGTDRAGNALTVREEIPDRQGTYETAEGQKDGFRAKYLLVRDTVAPVYSLQITSEHAARPDKNTQGNRYYLNAGFTASVDIEETNYDGGRIYVCRAEEKADARTDSQTIELTGHFSERLDSGSRHIVDAGEKEDGAYRYRIYGTDRAGNALVPAEDSANQVNLSGETQEITEKDVSAAGQQDQETEAELSVHVIVDTVRPELNVHVAEEGGETFYAAELTKEGKYEQNKNLPYRSRTKASAWIKVSDYSPSLLAYGMESSNPEAENKNVRYTGSGYSKDDSQTIELSGQQTVRLDSLSVTDLAGNTSSAAQNYDGAVSTWMYLDVEAPVYDELAPTARMTLSGKTEGETADGTPLYTGNVTAEVHVEDTNKNIRASGLYRVYYKVEVNGEDWTDRGLVSVKSRTDSGIAPRITDGVIDYGTAGAGNTAAGNEALTYDDRISFRFDSSDFNYNSVKLTVWTEDNAGNVIAEENRTEREFGIDITAPVIRVSYDNNDVKNERYFQADRTATIVVTERNFDESRTPIDTQAAASVSGWSHEAGSAANGDGDTWTCKVSWHTDGDYTFDVKTTDLAGNEMEGNVDYGDSAAPVDFTLDKTIPVIRITFDNEDVRNGKYYNAARNATVEITEHNFSADGAVITATAAIAEGQTAVPGITGWSSGNDKNVTTVPFRMDGDYTLEAEYTDLAGNTAEKVTIDPFTIDMTAPTLEIGGVEDRSANQGEVAPSIVYHDINYNGEATAVSIVGYKNKDGRNLKGSAQENAFGGSFVCANIEETPENDDIYTCTGYVEDMAGNSSEAELRFSVNRFGSTYMLDGPTEQLTEKYFTNEVPELHITEVNVNSLQFEEITATVNGEIRELQEGKDYQVEEKGGEDTWKEYNYTISPSFFQENGVYNLTVHSRDAAENENSNRTAKIAEYAKPVDFVLDTEKPEMIISGVEPDTRYVENQRTVTMLLEDNIGMKGLSVFLDGRLAESWDEEALAEAAGNVTIDIGSSHDWQELQVVASDKAGNRTEQKMRFLLTSNLWIQYIHNGPLLIATGIGVAALLILGIFLSGSRRKKKKGGEEKA